jgi:hypothetical protein
VLDTEFLIIKLNKCFCWLRLIIGGEQQWMRYFELFLEKKKCILLL